MIHTISVNHEELFFLELFRVALSEDNIEDRLTAIQCVKHDVVANQIELFEERVGRGWGKAPENADFAEWMRSTSPKRHEALYALTRVFDRYDGGNERRLNVAEHVGLLAYLSIHDGKLKGVQTPSGLIHQVTEIGRNSGTHGARDHDTVRKSWQTYRGVVHLGMALDICEQQSLPATNVLPLAEEIRQALSENCPKNTKDPYVPTAEQISFVFEPMT
ncbi:hypothetical protein [Shimia biformata]|uniref:hypothetical protein n=1 Tax=Shimia biformata TaxID=1294299 RepID=UPI00194DB38C|nr:hypothetical protein [Shimia biformata]